MDKQWRLMLLIFVPIIILGCFVLVEAGTYYAMRSGNPEVREMGSIIFALSGLVLFGLGTATGFWFYKIAASDGWFMSTEAAARDNEYDVRKLEAYSKSVDNAVKQMGKKPNERIIIDSQKYGERDVPGMN